MSTENPHRRRLEAWRDRYADRRGLVRDMLQDAVLLVTDAIDWADRDAARRVALAEERAAGRVEQAEFESDRQRDLRQSAEQRARSLQAVLDEKRTLRDERMRDGDDVKVTIIRGISGWQVSDLEEIAYRLRLGGAVDDTPVEIDKTAIRANVLDPNMVSLAAPERPKPELPPTTYESERPKARRFQWRWAALGAGLGTLVTHVLLAVLR